MNRHVLELWNERPDAVVVRTFFTQGGNPIERIYTPIGHSISDDEPAARAALLGYMKGESEKRWSAGWYLGLETALLGDPAYEWLVEKVGGWWTFNTPPKDWDRQTPWTWNVFIAGTLDELKASR